jgi:GNAT superfamily N-acetyltransferase
MEITARVWEGTDYLPHVFDRWLAEPGASFEVAELDGLVVGLQRLRPITREIVFYEGLRVAEEYRRRGIGRSMLRHAIEEAGAQGFKQARVITGNPAAGRLLESEGFRRLAHSSVWLAGRVEGPDLPRMASADEAAAALATMLHDDPALAAYGGVNGQWHEVLDLDEALLRRLAGEGLVRASSGGRALALIEPGTHNRLAVSFVAGSGAALQDLLTGLRFEADSQGYEGVRLYAPRTHPAADDFAEVGYHLADGQVERYSYAREL